jgi:hypothetical protein
MIKLILYTNLSEVKVDEKSYLSIPILKLTTGNIFRMELINKE